VCYVPKTKCPEQVRVNKKEWQGVSRQDFEFRQSCSELQEAPEYFKEGRHHGAYNQGREESSEKHTTASYEKESDSSSGGGGGCGGGGCGEVSFSCCFPNYFRVSSRGVSSD
jgi:hypothetical protein